jgi:hypothetical protein
MNYFCVTALILILTSCSSNLDSTRNDLLTSTTWIVQRELANSGTPKSDETIKFLYDGNYLSEYKEIKVEGKWNWTTEGEIFLKIQRVTVKGRSVNFDKSRNYYIRIRELSDKVLRTVERYVTDAWDSGFAEKKSYLPPM